MEQRITIQEKTKAGFKNFTSKNASAIEYRLKNGQSPSAIGSSCIDSGNPIEKIYGFEFGDAMGLRKTGGLFMPYNEKDMSSIYMKSELALPIEHQKVSDSFFTVHTKCAAAKAIALEENIPNVTDWLNYVGKNIRKNAINRNNLPNDIDDKTLIRAVEEQGAVHNYHAIMSYPFVQEAITEKRFTLRSCLYDMAAGQILQYDPISDSFFLLFDSIPETENNCCCSHKK